MNRVRIPFLAVLALVLLASAARATSSEDAFGAAIDRINESAARIADAQAKRARERKAAATAPSCTPAQIDAAYADLARCEASIKKAFGADVRDFKGVLNKGFSRSGMSLVLLTTTDAFFYHEDCDICAAVERCSLKDGSISAFKTAHSVDCRDLAPFLKKNVAYSACPLRP
ncbi:MAG: hypothetical protein NDJ72_06160 [Elusimicrobia bacterium]|nr:hypothetical protein [Elusimicrobiota bacterium]